MSTGAIVAIATAAALILIALLVLLPRMRERTRLRQLERELGQRREQVAGQHREEADTRARQAEAAEQRARMAEQEARRERAEAELHRERASAHERGLADDQLIEDHERERFAGTSAMTGQDKAPTARGDAAGREPTGSGRGRTSAHREGRRAAHEPAREEDFRQGRTDERDEPGGLFGRFRRRGTTERESGSRT
jgi:hypothetical protein